MTCASRTLSTASATKYQVDAFFILPQNDKSERTRASRQRASPAPASRSAGSWFARLNGWAICKTVASFGSLFQSSKPEKQAHTKPHQSCRYRRSIPLLPTGTINYHFHSIRSWWRKNPVITHLNWGLSIEPSPRRKCEYQGNHQSADSEDSKGNPIPC